MRLLIFLKSTNNLNFPLGLRCAKIGLAYFEKGNVVMMPYLWSKANSTVISSFKCIGVGRLCLYAGLSLFLVNRLSDVVVFDVDVFRA